MSREADAVYSVDVNALCLTKYDVIPQGPIGSLTAGTAEEEEEETGSYNGTISISDISAQLGPVEVLINEINDYPEISENSKVGVQNLIESVILSMESDQELQQWANSNTEATFMRHTKVHEKILRLLSRQSRNKAEAGTAIVAKAIVSKQKNDSSVLVTIAQTLYQVIVEQSVSSEAETPSTVVALSESETAPETVLSPESRLPSWVRFVQEP